MQRLPPQVEFSIELLFSSTHRNSSRFHLLKCKPYVYILQKIGLMMEALYQLRLRGREWRWRRLSYRRDHRQRQRSERQSRRCSCGAAGSVCQRLRWSQGCRCGAAGSVCVCRQWRQHRRCSCGATGSVCRRWWQWQDRVERRRKFPGVLLPDQAGKRSRRSSVAVVARACAIPRLLARSSFAVPLGSRQLLLCCGGLGTALVGGLLSPYCSLGPPASLQFKDEISSSHNTHHSTSTRIIECFQGRARSLLYEALA